MYVRQLHNSLAQHLLPSIYPLLYIPLKLVFSPCLLPLPLPVSTLSLPLLLRRQCGCCGQGYGSHTEHHGDSSWLPRWSEIKEQEIVTHRISVRRCTNKHIQYTQNPLQSKSCNYTPVLIFLSTHDIQPSSHCGHYPHHLKKQYISGKETWTKDLRNSVSLARDTCSRQQNKSRSSRLHLITQVHVNVWSLAMVLSLEKFLEPSQQSAVALS